MTSIAISLIKDPVYKEQFHTRMLAKLNNDTPGLIQDLRDADIPYWALEAWRYAIEIQHKDSLLALTDLCQTKRFAFNMPKELDNLPDIERAWPLSFPQVYNVWLKNTRYDLPRPRWVAALKYVLTHEEAVMEFKIKMDKTPHSTHTRLQAYIKVHAMEALQREGVFLELIAYYQEPSKKQVKVAALFSQRPFWDAGRIEKHWPGANAVKDVGESLSFSPKEQLARLRQLLTVGVETEGTLELPTFE